MNLRKTKMQEYNKLLLSIGTKKACGIKTVAFYLRKYLNIHTFISDDIMKAAIIFTEVDVVKLLMTYSFGYELPKYIELFKRLIEEGSTKWPNVKKDFLMFNLQLGIPVGKQYEHKYFKILRHLYETSGKYPTLADDTVYRAILGSNRLRVKLSPKYLISFTDISLVLQS